MKRVPKSNVYNLSTLVDYVNGEIHNEQDAVVLITGQPGRGKSTLAFHLMHSPRAKWSFSYDEGLAFTVPEHIQKGLDGPPRSGQWLDEGSGAMKRNWASPENKDLQTDLSIRRERYQFSLLLHVDRSWADALLDSHRVDFWIHLDKMGRGTIYRSVERSAFQKKPFWQRSLGPDGVPVSFTFPQAKGEKWLEYKRRKKALEERRDEFFKTVKSPPRDQQRQRAEELVAMVLEYEVALQPLVARIKKRELERVRK